jgi:hypothetical protein
MTGFMDKVHRLQADDHRYYHQSRINQTLRLVFVDPAAAGLVGWLVGMVTRQSGHIFFEPRGFDDAHGVSYEHKESIKAGYNMRRKAILIGIWLGLPALLLADRNLSGLIVPAAGAAGYVHDVGLLWLALGAGGLIFRTLHLFFLRGPAWGLAWCAKILLDPFHNVAIYWRSPAALLRGELLDPLEDPRRLA